MSKILYKLIFIINKIRNFSGNNNIFFKILVKIYLTNICIIFIKKINKILALWFKKIFILYIITLDKETKMDS